MCLINKRITRIFLSHELYVAPAIVSSANELSNAVQSATNVLLVAQQRVNIIETKAYVSYRHYPSQGQGIQPLDTSLCNRTVLQRYRKALILIYSLDLTNNGRYSVSI